MVTQRQDNKSYRKLTTQLRAELRLEAEARKVFAAERKVHQGLKRAVWGVFAAESARVFHARLVTLREYLQTYCPESPWPQGDLGHWRDLTATAPEVKAPNLDTRAKALAALPTLQDEPNPWEEL